jgi:hypothetical protein
VYCKSADLHFLDASEHLISSDFSPLFIGLSIQTSLTGESQERIPTNARKTRYLIFIEYLLSPAFFDERRKGRALFELSHRNLIR